MKNLGSGVEVEKRKEIIKLVKSVSGYVVGMSTMRLTSQRNSGLPIHV